MMLIVSLKHRIKGNKGIKIKKKFLRKPQSNFQRYVKKIEVLAKKRFSYTYKIKQNKTKKKKKHVIHTVCKNSPNLVGFCHSD